MPEHKIGTREEWQAARDELAKLEAEHGELNQEIKKKRLELPWVPVEKEYVFDTQDGKKSLAELFDGRSQLWPTTSCTARITARSLPRLHEPRRRVQRLPDPPEQAGRSSLLLARADRSPHRLQGADGLGFLRLDVRDRLPLGLRARIDRRSFCRSPGSREMVDNPPEWIGVVRAGGRGAQGRTARGPATSRSRDNGTVYHHLHGHGTRPVRPASLQHAAGAGAEAAARRAPLLAQGRVPGLIGHGGSRQPLVPRWRLDRARFVLLGALLAPTVAAWLVTDDRMGGMESTPGCPSVPSASTSASGW